MEGSTLESLNAQFGIAGQVEFRAGPGGLVLAEIANAHAGAQIALQGAQVVAFRPQGSAPVLFQSSRAIWAPGKAIRGGIPICWPWFGPHPTDTTKPQHGFVRTVLWSVLATSGLADGTTEVRLGLGDTPATRALWPHRFELTLTVQVGRELRLVLDTHNVDNQPMPLTEALHTYFHVGDIGAVVVRGLEGTPYIDKVEGGQRKLQQGPVTIDAETDRVYTNTSGPCVVDDRTLQRRIQITKEGSQSTVVWNPWREKARQMADFGAEEYTQMICVEAGNALDNEVRLGPDADHRLVMAIRVAPV